MSVLPCRSDPEKWFAKDRVLLGQAVHACRVHCPWLVGCAQEPAPVDGVLAGVLFTQQRIPDGYQPEEVKCAACIPAKPLHGTEAGYARHRRAKESPCTPCRNAHNAGVVRRRRPKEPKEVEPPKDVHEERQRVLVEAMKKTA